MFLHKLSLNIKQILITLLIVSFTFFAAALIYAVTSDGKTTPPFTAHIASTTGALEVVPMRTELKLISNNNPAALITWPTSVTAQGDNWKAAEQYIQVTGFETYTTWGIQIYTNNTSASALPKFDNPGKDPAGLVRATDDPATPENEIGKSALPMCWRAAVDKKFNPTAAPNEFSITQKYIASSDFYVLLRTDADYISDTSYFAPWSWVLDKATPDSDPTQAGNQPFGDYQVYATFVGSDGVQIASKRWLTIPERGSVYYIYLGGKFISAKAGATYTTNQLTVEMYHL